MELNILRTLGQQTFQENQETLTEFTELGGGFRLS